jgi:hypothetical protein
MNAVHLSTPMRQLAEYFSPEFMNFGTNAPEAGYTFLVKSANRCRSGPSTGVNDHGFCDDQPNTAFSPLCMVIRLSLVGQAVGIGKIGGMGRGKNPVFYRRLPNSYGGKQIIEPIFHKRLLLKIFGGCPLSPNREIQHLNLDAVLYAAALLSLTFCAGNACLDFFYVQKSNRAAICASQEEIESISF